MVWFYQRYVDDGDLVLQRLKKSVKFNKVTKTLEDDNPDEDDMMTDEGVLNIVKQMADVIIPMITWEADSVDKHVDNEKPADAWAQGWECGNIEKGF